MDAVSDQFLMLGGTVNGEIKQGGGPDQAEGTGRHHHGTLTLGDSGTVPERSHVPATRMASCGKGFAFSRSGREGIEGFSGAEREAHCQGLAHLLLLPHSNVLGDFSFMNDRRDPGRECYLSFDLYRVTAVERHAKLGKPVTQHRGDRHDSLGSTHLW
jgi:hypothetical protein